MLKFLVLFFLADFAAAFCPLNSVRSQSRAKCFVFYNFPMTFEQADNFCYNLGGHLASEINAFESSTIAALAKDANAFVNQYWIGGRTLNKQNYTWVDGTPFTFQKWAVGEPKNDCVYVQAASAQWATTYCEGLLPFACALDPLTNVPPCESGWTWFQQTNACYKSIRNFDSFYAAESQCGTMNAHLASIHSQAENNLVFDLGTANYKLGITEHDLQTWIGLKRDCHSCAWTWTDNSTLDFPAWTKDEPANDYDKQDCVELYTDDATGLGSSNVGYWNNVKCTNDKRNAICKKPARNGR